MAKDIKPLLAAVALLPAAWWYHFQDHEDTSEADSSRAPAVLSFTLEQLRRYDGKPGHEGGDGDGLLLAVWGRVFNVTNAPEFYAPGSGYALFSGHDCTRAFALSSTKKKNLNQPIDDLQENKIKTLNDTYWSTYVHKYPIIGVLSDPPYNPATYDQFAGPFDQVKATRSNLNESLAGDAATEPKTKRKSRCPVTRAARAVRDVVVELLPRLQLTR